MDGERAPQEHVHRNRARWDAEAKDYVAAGERAWARAEPAWGIWRVAESQLHVLPGNLAGKEAIELGCGTAYISAWLARRGARVVGIDASMAQLETARRLQRQHGLEFPLIHADAELVPCRDVAFDLAISEYGACLWADPDRWLPEAARLLRPAGELIFLVNSSLVTLCVPAEDDSPATDRLLRPAFGMFRIEWPGDPGVEFHLSHGEWIKRLRSSGFEIEDLIEVRPPETATTRYPFVTLEWSRQWPAEEIWRARDAGDGGLREKAIDDLLIRGGHLIDGTGAPGREGDVSIRAGRIVAIERRSSRPAHRTIDARGQVVAPGLIDIHTHSDFTLPLNPRAESKIRQGVTLEVVGNCGFSAAPALPERLAMLQEYLAPSAPGLELHQATFTEYVASFPPTSVNVIFQVGHNTLRLMTAGMESRPVTKEELATMERLLVEALAAGAWGLSSGLFTAPGCYADSAEILALARVLRRHGGAYSSHVRDEANHVGEAIREAIAVAEATGVHVQIAHLKLSGVDNWGGAGRLLGEIAAARRRGLPVDCDAYPYDTATNPLRNLLPRWVIEGGIPAMLERLGRAEVRVRLRADIARDGLSNFGRIPSWDVVRIAVAPNLSDEAGHTLGEIARRRGVDPLDGVCDVLVADRGATRILITSMSEQDVHEITGTPWVLVGSDANALATVGPTRRGKPHPRSYGTHARLLGPVVRDLGLLTLPAAVHKTTGAAAAALGLDDRGVLREGCWADVAVFDPARIIDLATYDDPHRYALGVSTVVVNGEVVVDGGDHTGALSGRRLRRRI